MNPVRVTLVTIALSAVGSVGAADGLAAGGLSISPVFLEHEARPGRVGEVRVVNGSTRAVAIRVAVRPWIQSRSGAVRPDDRRRLAQVRLGASSFTLTPGAARRVPVTLLTRPRSGSLYGAIDVLGTPRIKRPRKGIRARYRLLAGLRLNPSAAARRLAVRLGAARGASGRVALPVRNTGNTVAPITGAVIVSSPSGTWRAAIPGRRVLPGAVVDLRPALGRLPRGRYRARITLRQGGRRVAAATRRLQVR